MIMISVMTMKVSTIIIIDNSSLPSTVDHRRHDDEDVCAHEDEDDGEHGS